MTQCQPYSLLVPGGRSVLHCSIFCSVGGRIRWHLRLVWARPRLSLPCSQLPVGGCRALVKCSATFFSYSECLFWFCHRLLLRRVNPHSGRCSDGSSVSLGNARVKQYCRIPEDGARSKGDGETATCLWRRDILPACRFADIHAAWLVLFQLPHVNFPCPGGHAPTHSRLAARLNPCPDERPIGGHGRWLPGKRGWGRGMEQKVKRAGGTPALRNPDLAFAAFYGEHGMPGRSKHARGLPTETTRSAGQPLFL
jgi:hypothetical protein